MRRLLLPLILLPLLSAAKGPYSALLVTGDTITTPEYRRKGDTLDFAGMAKLHWKDVVLLWNDKERWTFTYPHGNLKEFREEGWDGCALGHICALRFEKTRLLFDSLPIPPNWRRKALLLPCYRARLEGKGIHTNAKGDPAEKPEKEKGTGGIAIGRPSQIILITGDTIFLKKEFHQKDSLLCAYGGKCIPVDSILLFRSVKGQFYFNAKSRRRFQLEEPVPDMSMGSAARIHANRMFNAEYSWEECPIPDRMKTDPGFVAAYRLELVSKIEVIERRIKRANTISAIGGGLSGSVHGVAGAAVGASARAALGNDTYMPSFWNSPMPPE